MDGLKNLLENFSGEVYNLCYEIMTTREDQTKAFEYVCKNLIECPKNGTIQIAEHFSEDEFERYESLYEDMVRGILTTNIKKCNYGVIAVEDFYKSLWEIYCTVFPTEKGKAFAFYCTVSSRLIPYQYMGKPLSMSSEQFRMLTEQNNEVIEKIRLIDRSHYSQRTERASLLLNCINEVEKYESKVVVLAHALSILGSNRMKAVPSEKIIDSIIQRIDKKIEELEAEESAKEDSE